MRPISRTTRTLIVAVACLASGIAQRALAGGPVQVADIVEKRIESPHPYAAAAVPGGVAWRHTLRWPGASFIVVHFERFDLAPGDTLVLSDPAGQVRHVYRGRGLHDKGGDFFGLSVAGPEMEIALYSADPVGGHFGIAIDRWTHGYPQDAEDGRSICGTDDSRDVECYKDTYPAEYLRARPVVRLLKSGFVLCTGWLGSCENHVITNSHCVASQYELGNVEFQFEAKRPVCDGTTSTVDLQLQSGTLLEADQSRDVAMIMPNLDGHDPQAIFGFLQWDVRDPNLGEIIYIPGHMANRPKRLSLESTDPRDVTRRCQVATLTNPPCIAGGPLDVGYFCDTDGGSSGSPVLSATSHRVIALHHCGDCPTNPNTAVPITDVYDFLQASAHPLPLCSTCSAPPVPADPVAFSPTVGQIKLDWIAAAGAAKYSVLRSTVSCDAGFEKLGETTTSAYVDTAVVPGTQYFYRLASVADCQSVSAWSACAASGADGVCTMPPRFVGLTSVTNGKIATCGIDVAWSEATPRCSAVRYNVYRSTLATVEPEPGNLVARCLTALGWRDDDTQPATRYSYLIRAEDSGSSGGGPCGGGYEDANRTTGSTVPTGPESVIQSWGFEPMTIGWTLGSEWQMAPPRAKGGSNPSGGMGSPDPDQAYAGYYVLGHDLSGAGAASGNYENSLTTAASAQSPAFSTAGRANVRVRFARWLGTDRSSRDRASFSVHDGSTWNDVWSNPDTVLFDGAWTLVDYDVSRFLANRSAARLRFGQMSDASGNACGWNVDDLVVYEQTACQGASPALPPVPDGAFAPGAPMTVQRGPGDQIVVSWDVQRCASSGYNLFYGDSDRLPTLSYDGASCTLGATGSATVTLPTPQPGHATWWVVAGSSGAREGPHGYDWRGVLRNVDAGGRCGVTSQTTSGGCP